MLGAICGDIIGSVYEWDNIKTKDFELFSPRCTFTDDSVLTVALADSILRDVPYADNIRAFYRLYPNRGYGGNFCLWAGNPGRGPYHSFGNGAAMRISPVAWAYDDLDRVLERAAAFTAPTHDHPEGIKGGQALAAAVYLARNGASKGDIKAYLETSFGYDLGQTLDEIRPDYRFDVSCQGTVPQAIRAFLEACGFEDAIRNAISLGGDSDTLACITGAVAEAFYGGVPEDIARQVWTILDERLGGITRAFMDRYRKDSGR